jgi:hypothetical protein
MNPTPGAGMALGAENEPLTVAEGLPVDAFSIARPGARLADKVIPLDREASTDGRIT